MDDITKKNEEAILNRYLASNPQARAWLDHCSAAMAAERRHRLTYVTAEELAIYEEARRDMMTWWAAHPQFRALVDEGKADLYRESGVSGIPHIGDLDFDPARLGMHRQIVDEQNQRDAAKSAKEARKAARAAKRRGETPATETPGKSTRVAYMRLVS